MSLWFDGIQVPAGGISGVCTAEKYRGRGFALACLDRALKVHKENDELLSVLFGIPHFYERHGYAAVMPWYETIVPRLAMEIAHQPPKTRDAAPSDEFRLSMIYESSVKDRIGAVVRNPMFRTEPRKQVRWRTEVTTQLILDEQDNIAAYVIRTPRDEKNFEVIEGFAQESGGYTTLLRYLGHQMVEHNLAEITLALPPDDRFARVLHRRGARCIVKRPNTGGGMAKIINLNRFCQILRPMFLNRSRALPATEVPSHVSFEGEESATISLHGTARPITISASLSTITQLFFGYLLPADTLSLLPATRRRESLLTLFPSTYPFMYLRDRF